jgi:HAD superfamily hydrolase (TIGR01450 family)
MRKQNSLASNQPLFLNQIPQCSTDSAIQKVTKSYNSDIKTGPQTCLDFAATASKLRLVIDFSTYAAVLLDLDGTLYHEDHVLPGAAQLVRRLQAQGQIYACLTNSTTSPQRLQARLARMGIEMPVDNIYTAAAAAADYVLEHFPHPPRVFSLATEGLHEMLDGKVKWVEAIGEPCDVVIGGAPANTFATAERQRIALYLLRAGAALVGVCADRVYPSPRGLEFGSGAMTSMLAYAAGVKPVYAGKPEAIFFQELCQKLGVEPSRCILIGDNLESDIAGAAKLGMDTILTLTGVSHQADVDRVAANLKPGRVVENLTHC